MSLSSQTCSSAASGRRPDSAVCSSATLQFVAGKRFLTSHATLTASRPRRGQTSADGALFFSACLARENERKSGACSTANPRFAESQTPSELLCYSDVDAKGTSISLLVYRTMTIAFAGRFRVGFYEIAASPSALDQAYSPRTYQQPELLMARGAQQSRSLSVLGTITK